MLKKGVWYTHHAVQLSIGRVLFASQFIQDKIVLDVGCGTGSVLAALVHSCKFAVGLDISLENYRIVGHNRYKFEFVVADAKHLPIREEAMDVIMAFEVIEHIDDLSSFLANCTRSLKKGGLLLCSTPNRKYFSGNAKPWFPGHIRELTIDEFKDTMRRYFKETSLYGQFTTNSGVSILEKLIHTENLLKKALFWVIGRRNAIRLANKILRIVRSKEALEEITELKFTDHTSFEECYRVTPLTDEHVRYLVALARKDFRDT